MEPTDFLETAELLASKQEETHLRTSIGRSYYSALLYFREYLRKLGLEKRKPESDAHAFVIQCLQWGEVKSASKASACLNSLKSTRTDADYDLNKAISQKEAKDTLKQARELISNFALTQQEDDTLINKATAYAKRKDWI